MLWVKGAAAVVCLGLAAGVEAATVNYYYAGQPGSVSNQADPAARTLFNTGLLTVDRSRLDGGPSLANRTISYVPYADDPDPSAGAVAFDFALGTGSEEVTFDLTFDADENLASWRFSSFFMITPSDWEDFRVSSTGDAYYRADYDGSAAHRTALGFLEGIGLREGTPEFEAQYCGGWAGPEFGCSDWGEPSPAWAATFLALGAGDWFRDDLLGFAAQVQLNTIAALADLPRSYHDIAPAAVPVPAPLILIGSALAGLAVLRRRGSRMAPA